MFAYHWNRVPGDAKRPLLAVKVDSPFSASKPGVASSASRQGLAMNPRLIFLVCLELDGFESWLHLNQLNGPANLISLGTLTLEK